MVPFFIRPLTGMVANRIFSSFIFPNTRRNLSLLETHLSESSGGYLCGSTLSAADILMSFPLIAANDKFDGFGEWKDGGWRKEFPKVADYVTRLEAEEGYKKSVEKIKEIDGDFEAI
jgi:glutathione S-transferase